MTTVESPHRRRRRFLVSFPLKVWLPEERKHSPSKGGEYAKTEDISTTGCYFSLARVLPVGSKIELEVQMPPLEGVPEGITLRCHGTVVRVDSGTTGKVGIGCRIDHYWQAKQGGRLRKIRVA
jgi:hypothetical protein